MTGNKELIKNGLHNNMLLVLLHNTVACFNSLHSSFINIGAHIIIIIFILKCNVCLSAMEDHGKGFELEASVTVYLAMEHMKLELGNLCEWQSWH